jgi:hypothetical protein
MLPDRIKNLFAKEASLEGAARHGLVWIIEALSDLVSHK